MRANGSRFRGCHVSRRCAFVAPPLSVADCRFEPRCCLGRLRDMCSGQRGGGACIRANSRGFGCGLGLGMWSPRVIIFTTLRRKRSEPLQLGLPSLVAQSLRRLPTGEGMGSSSASFDLRCAYLMGRPSENPRHSEGVWEAPPEVPASMFPGERSPQSLGRSSEGHRGLGEAWQSSREQLHFLLQDGVRDGCNSHVFSLGLTIRVPCSKLSPDSW